MWLSLKPKKLKKYLVKGHTLKDFVYTSISMGFRFNCRQIKSINYVAMKSMCTGTPGAGSGKVNIFFFPILTMQ